MSDDDQTAEAVEQDQDDAFRYHQKKFILITRFARYEVSVTIILEFDEIQKTYNPSDKPPVITGCTHLNLDTIGNDHSSLFPHVYASEYRIPYESSYGASQFIERLPFFVVLAKYSFSHDIAIIDFKCRDFDFLEKAVILMRLDDEFREEQIIYEGSLTRKQIVEMVEKDDTWCGTTFLTIQPTNNAMSIVPSSKVLDVYQSSAGSILKITRDDAVRMFTTSTVKQVNVSDILYTSKTMYLKGSEIIFRESITELPVYKNKKQIRAGRVMNTTSFGYISLESESGARVRIPGGNLVTTKGGITKRAYDLKLQDEIVYTNVDTVREGIATGRDTYKVTGIESIAPTIQVSVLPFPLELVVGHKVNFNNLDQDKRRLFSSPPALYADSTQGQLSKMDSHDLSLLPNGWTSWVGMKNVRSVTTSLSQIETAYGLTPNVFRKSSVTTLLDLMATKDPKSTQSEKVTRIKNLFRKALGQNADFNKKPFNLIILAYLTSNEHSPPSSGYIKSLSYNNDKLLSRQEFSALERLIESSSGQAYLDSEIVNGSPTFSLRTSPNRATNFIITGDNPFSIISITCRRVTSRHPVRRKDSTMDRIEEINFNTENGESFTASKVVLKGRSDNTRIALLYPRGFVGSSNPSTFVNMTSGLVNIRPSLTPEKPYSDITLTQNAFHRQTNVFERGHPYYDATLDGIRTGVFRKAGPEDFPLDTGLCSVTYNENFVFLISDSAENVFYIKNFVPWFIASDYGTLVISSTLLSDNNIDSIMREVSRWENAVGTEFTGIIFPQNDRIFNSTHKIITANEDYNERYQDPSYTGIILLDMSPTAILEHFLVSLSPRGRSIARLGRFKNFRNFEPNDRREAGEACSLEEAVLELNICHSVSVSIEGVEGYNRGPTSVLPGTVSLTNKDGKFALTYVLSKYAGSPSRLTVNVPRGVLDPKTSDSPQLKNRDLVTPSTMMNCHDIVRIFTGMTRMEARRRPKGTNYRVNMKFSNLEDTKHRCAIRIIGLLNGYRHLVDLYQKASLAARQEFVNALKLRGNQLVSDTSTNLYNANTRLHSWDSLFPYSVGLTPPMREQTINSLSKQSSLEDVASLDKRISIVYMTVNSLLIELFFCFFGVLGLLPPKLRELDSKTNATLAKILNVSPERRVLSTLSCIRIILELMYETFFTDGIDVIFQENSLLFTTTCIILGELKSNLVT